MTTPKESKTPKWKGSLSRLLSCGSGKKDIDENQNAPLAMSLLNKAEDEGEVNYDVVTTMATPGHGEEEEVEISYSEVKAIGKGTFGIVYRAKLCDTGDLVAIKKVFHDERYKNRELQMMRRLDHPNVLDLRYFFYSRGERYKSNEVYLNMLLDYMPETLYSVAQCDGTRTKPLMDIAYVRLYMYQVFRSLAYLHTIGICHRDIKPQNLLLNPDTHVIKVCDFGSAKELVAGEANIAYICSRYYRAPELVLGTTNYTSQIDVWSAGCVLGELLLGQPIFPGANGPDQLVEIIKILGTPSVEDLYEINPNYTDMRFPQLMPHPWHKVFRETTDMDVIDLATHVLVYAPSRRFHPIEAVAHQFFEPLRRGFVRLPDGKPPPSTLFNFTREELAINPDLNSRLAPADGLDYSHYEAAELSNQDTSRLESSSKPHSVLGQIGGSFRSSFRGIRKVASTSSSGKKKKKKKKSSGIEDESGIQEVPTELNFSGADEEHLEDGERVERVEESGSEYRVEGADIHLRPGSEEMNTSAVSHVSGRHDDSIPHHYRQHLERTDDDDVDAVTGRLGDVNIDETSGSKKKKKKPTRPKAPAPLPADIERSIEAQMISTSYGESDVIADTPHKNSTPSSGKKKKKKPAASTPADDNEARSFEESPDFAAQMTYDDTIRSFQEEPPLASDLTSPGNGSQVKVTKKKRPKTSKKPTAEGDEERSNEGMGEKRHRKKRGDTDL